jgi:hypothetical protein
VCPFWPNSHILIKSSSYTKAYVHVWRKQFDFEIIVPFQFYTFTVILTNHKTKTHAMDRLNNLHLMSNVMELKGNKLAAILGTAEICQLLFIQQQKSHDN